MDRLSGDARIPGAEGATYGSYESLRQQDREEYLTFYLKVSDAVLHLFQEFHMEDKRKREAGAVLCGKRSIIFSV